MSDECTEAVVNVPAFVIAGCGDRKKSNVLDLPQDVTNMFKKNVKMWKFMASTHDFHLSQAD